MRLGGTSPSFEAKLGGFTGAPWRVAVCERKRTAGWYRGFDGFYTEYLRRTLIASGPTRIRELTVVESTRLCSTNARAYSAAEKDTAPDQFHFSPSWAETSVIRCFSRTRRREGSADPGGYCRDREAVFEERYDTGADGTSPGKGGKGLPSARVLRARGVPCMLGRRPLGVSSSESCGGRLSSACTGDEGDAAARFCSTTPEASRDEALRATREKRCSSTDGYATGILEAPATISDAVNERGRRGGGGAGRRTGGTLWSGIVAPPDRGTAIDFDPRKKLRT